MAPGPLEQEIAPNIAAALNSEAELVAAFTHHTAMAMALDLVVQTMGGSPTDMEEFERDFKKRQTFMLMCLELLKKIFDQRCTVPVLEVAMDRGVLWVMQQFHTLVKEGVAQVDDHDCGAPDCPVGQSREWWPVLRDKLSSHINELQASDNAVDAGGENN